MDVLVKALQNEGALHTKIVKAYSLIAEIMHLDELNTRQTKLLAWHNFF